jgi:hypothetical protein
MCARYGSKAQKRHAALELSLAIRVGRVVIATVKKLRTPR